MIKEIKKKIKYNLGLTNNQTNLLILIFFTSIFQGFIYNLIDHKIFSKKYFILTIIMNLIYSLFYYKTYVNADMIKHDKEKDKENISPNYKDD